MDNEFIIQLLAALDQENSFKKILGDIKSIQKRLEGASAGKIKLSADIDDKFKATLQNMAKTSGAASAGKDLGKELADNLINSFNIKAKDAQRQIKSLSSSLYKMNVKELKTGLEDPAFIDILDKLGMTIQKNANTIQQRMGIYDEFYNYFQGLSKIKIPDVVRTELGRDWNNMRLTSASKFVTNMSGIELDAVYQEMADKFKDIFSGTTDQTEQFREIVNAVRAYKADIDELTPLDPSAMDGVWDGLVTSVGSMTLKIREELDMLPEAFEETGARIKTSLLDIDESFDAAGIEELAGDVKAYFQSITGVGEKDIKLQFFKDADEEITSFSATLEKGQGIIERYDFALDDLGKFTYSGGSLTDRSGAELEKVAAKTAEYQQKLEALKRTYQIFLSGTSATNPFRALVESIDFTNVTDKVGLDVMVDKLRQAEAQAKALNASVNTDWSSTGAQKMVQDLGNMGRQIDILEENFKGANFQLPDSITKAFQDMRDTLSQIDTIEDPQKKIENYNQLKSALKDLKDQYTLLYKQQKNVDQVDNLLSQKQKLGSEIVSWMVSNQRESRAFDDILVKIIRDMEGITKGSELDKLSKQFQAVKAEAEALDKTSRGFFQDAKEQMAGALSDTVKYSASIGIVNRTKQAIKEMLAEVESLQGAMIEFNKVADLSQEELEDLSRRAFEVGDKVAKTGKDIVDGMSEFRRAGYSTDELLGMSEAANIMTNVADGITEVSDAASALIAIMRGYDISSSDIMGIVDILNEVSNNSPVSFDDLAKGLERTAGTLSQTGTSLAENVGLLTGGFAQLRNMEKVSTGLLTISQRLRGVGEDGEAVDGLSAKLQEDFGSIGVAIEDANGDLRSTYDIINDYAKIFPSLSSKQKQYFGELAAGKPQVKVWNAIVSQIDDVERAIDQADDSLGSAVRENEIYMDSIAGARNAFSNAMAELSKEAVDEQWITDFIKAGTSLLQMLTNIISTDTVVRDSIGTIADTIKDLAGLLEDLSENKFLAGLAQAFITLKTVQMGADIVQMATGAKEAKGMFASLMNVVKGYGTTQKTANTIIDAATSATEAMTGSVAENKAGILGCVSAIGKWAAANPALAAGVAAGTVALVAGAKAVNDYIHRVENAKEALSESRNNFDNVNSTIKSLSSELQTNRERIRELKAMGTLTYVEQSELENLQAATRELERQYDIETKKKASAARELFEDNVVAFEAEFTPGDISQTYADILKDQDISIDTLMAQKGIEPLIAALSKVRDTKEEAFTEGNDALIDDLTSTEKECREKLEEQLFTLEKYRINMQDILDDRDFTANEQRFYDNLQTGIRMIYQETDPNKWNSMALDEVFDTKDIEHTKEEFIELAKAGRLDAAIADCKVLNKALSEADLILQDGQTATEAFRQEMEALARSGGEFVEVMDTPSQTSYTDMVTQLDAMTASFDALNEAYGHFKDGQAISFDDLSSLMEQFKDVSGVESYVKAIQDAKGSIEGTQAAFDDLLSAYLQQSDILRQVTDENKDLIVSYLEEKGVANAASIAENALAANKRIATIDTRNLTKEVMDELVALADEKDALDEVTAQIYSYVLEKCNANNVALSTEGDIQNIMALVSACGSGISALQALANAKNGVFSSLATGSPNKNSTYGGMSVDEAVALTRASKHGLPTVTSNSFDAFKTGVQKQEAYVADVTKAAQAEIDAVFAKLKGTTQATSNGGAGGGSGKSGGGSGSSAKEATIDYFDWIETLIQRTDEKIEKLQKKATDAKGWQAKNKLQDTVYDELQNKLVALQLEHDRYMQEATSVGLSDIYINKIQNGELDIEQIADDNLKQMIQDYQKWYDKAKECADAIDDVNDAIRETREQKLDNIINDYDKLVSLLKSYTEYRERLIDVRDRMGDSPTQSDYQRLIDDQEGIYRQLQEKYNELEAELTSGGIEEGTEKWREMKQELIDIQIEMLDCADAVEDFKDKIFEIRFKPLEDLADKLSFLNKQLDNMLTLIGDEALTKEGNLTDRGLAVVGLYGQQLITAKREAEEYRQALKALHATFQNGDITLDEYNEKLYEYQEAQQQAALATKEARDAIISLREQAIEEEIDYMNDLIDKKKELLDAEEDLYEYQKKIAEDNKSIAALERQIAALSLSTNRADIAQRLKLEEQLAEARRDLAEYQHDHDIDAQKDALDQQAEDYEKAKRDEIENLKTNLDAQDALIEKYLGQVKDNYHTVYGILTDCADAYNMEVTEDLTNPFSSAEAATQSFTDAFADMVATIQYQIDSIDWSNLTRGLDGIGYGGSGGDDGLDDFEDVTGQGKWQTGKNGKWWYGEEPTADGDYWYASDGYYNINGKTYGFDQNGYMLTEWDDTYGDWSYFDASNGDMQRSQWIKGKGKDWYYVDHNGRMVTDAVVKAKDGKGYYYLDDDGVWDESQGTLTKEEVDELGYDIAYAKGTKNAKRGRAKVNEDGYELMITPKGELIDLKGGEEIITADERTRLLEMLDDPLFLQKELATGAWDNVINDASMFLGSPYRGQTGDFVCTSSYNVENKVVVQGDASEKTIGLIQNELDDFVKHRMVPEFDRAMKYRLMRR